MSMEAEDYFEVEAIIDEKTSHAGKRGTFYLIKWKGYDETHNTWEPSTNVNALAISEWQRKNPRKSVQKRSRGRPVRNPKPVFVEPTESPTTSMDIPDMEVKELEVKIVVNNKLNLPLLDQPLTQFECDAVHSENVHQLADKKIIKIIESFRMRGTIFHSIKLEGQEENELVIHTALNVLRPDLVIKYFTSLVIWTK